VGRTVGKVGAFAAKTGSIFAAAASLGSLGLPAYAIGGIIGGGVSALKNLKNQNLNKTQKLKKILVSAGLGAVLGFAFSKLRAMTDGVDFSSSPDVDTSSATPDADTSGAASGGVGEGRIIPSPNGDGVLIEVEVEIDDTFGAAKGKLEADAEAKLKALTTYANEMGDLRGGTTVKGMQPVSAEIVDGVLKKTYFVPTDSVDLGIDTETLQQDFNEPATNNNLETGESPNLETLQNMPRIPNETFSYTDNAKGYLLSNNPKGISIAVETNLLDTNSAFKDENTALKYFSKLTGLSVDEVSNQMQEIGIDTNRGRGALNFGKTTYYYLPKQ
ncbi:MAG: hypothetical protein RL642_1660, partial [Bacteroidota bacterium]